MWTFWVRHRRRLPLIRQGIRRKSEKKVQSTLVCGKIITFLALKSGKIVTMLFKALNEWRCDDRIRGRSSGLWVDARQLHDAVSDDAFLGRCDYEAEQQSGKGEDVEGPDRSTSRHAVWFVRNCFQTMKGATRSSSLSHEIIISENQKLESYSRKHSSNLFIWLT